MQEKKHQKRCKLSREDKMPVDAIEGYNKVSRKDQFICVYLCETLLQTVEVTSVHKRDVHKLTFGTLQTTFFMVVNGT